MNFNEFQEYKKYFQDEYKYDQKTALEDLNHKFSVKSITQDQFDEIKRTLRNVKNDNLLKVMKKMKKISLIELSPKDYIIPRLEIEAGTFALLCASGGSGKTMLSQYILLCISSNKPLFNLFPVSPGAVLHIDEEQSELQTMRRYIRLSNGLDTDFGDLDRAEINFRLDTGDLTKNEINLTNLLNGKRLCLIDSLKATSETDENSPQIELYLKMLKRVASKTKCAILLIHQKGKSNNGARQTGRGHSSIYDSVDVQIDLDKEEDDNVYTVKCQKNRDGDFFDGFKYQIKDVGNFIKEQNCKEKLVFEILQSSIKKEEVNKSIEILKILQTVGKSMTQSSLYDLIKGDKGLFAEHLEVLHKDDLISIQRGDKNSKQISISDKGKEKIKMDIEYGATNEN